MPQGCHLFRALAIAMILLPNAPAQPLEPGRTQWKLATFTWVKRVPAEPGAPPNAHPAQPSEAALLNALGVVNAKVEGTDTPLFTPSELRPLAKALQEAFAAARPSEDLVLLSTQRRGGHFLDPALAVTARLFLSEGALNLIVHDTRLDFMDRYSADRTLPTFIYGSRQTASAVALQAGSVPQLRSDWLALPLRDAPAAATAMPAAAQAIPAPAVAVPAPGSSTKDAAFYDLQAQRLKALKRLLDEHLLSEAEYQQKREEILKSL